MRIAIIGTGIAGQSHLLDSVTEPRLEVTAVVGRRRNIVEEVAHRFGIPRVFTSFEALLGAGPLDAVVVATPIRVLPFHVVQALRARLWVLAEKPLAAAFAPLRIMAGLEGVAGRRMLTIAYNRRYSTEWIAARDWIAHGRIGSIRRISMELRGPFNLRFGSAAESHRSDPADCAAGALLDSGSHAFDAVQFLTGCLPEVTVARLRFNARGLDIAGRVTCRHVEVCLEDSSQESKTCVIEGDRGRIVIGGQNATLDVIDSSCAVSASWVARPVDDLLKMRDGLVPLGATLSDCENVIRTISAAYRLAGRPLDRCWIRPRAKAIARTSGAC